MILPIKNTQWLDSDGDGLGDNWDPSLLAGNRADHWPGESISNAYRSDPSPFDYDNDGFEDETLNEFGSIGPFDDCPLIYGLSINDLVVVLIQMRMDLVTMRLIAIQEMQHSIKTTI